MANVAPRISMIALLAVAGLAFAGIQGQSVTDLDDFSDARLLRDLQDELEDIYYDPYYRHDPSYADEEVALETLYEEIMYALSDAGDGYDEAWDDGGDTWDEWDADQAELWDEWDMDYEQDWEGEDTWDGEEILFSDLEAEMLEAGTSLDEVVWNALYEAAGEVAARQRTWTITFASVSANAFAQDRNKRGKTKTAVRNTTQGIVAAVKDR